MKFGVKGGIRYLPQNFVFPEDVAVISQSEPSAWYAMTRGLCTTFSAMNFILASSKVSARRGVLPDGQKDPFQKDKSL